MRLFVRFQLMFEGERPVTSWVLTMISLATRRHVRQYNMVPQQMGFGECFRALFALISAVSKCGAMKYLVNVNVVMYSLMSLQMCARPKSLGTTFKCT